jgi:hypothetical protein
MHSEYVPQEAAGSEAHRSQTGNGPLNLTSLSGFAPCLSFFKLEMYRALLWNLTTCLLCSLNVLETFNNAHNTVTGKQRPGSSGLEDHVH